MDKRSVILHWLNAFPCCNPLHKLEELVHGNQLIELAAIINPIKSEIDEVHSYVSEKKIEFIKETIMSHYHMDVEKLVNFDLFTIGNITETVKVALLLLSAVVLHLASFPEQTLLNPLHELEAQLQEQIRNYLQKILDANNVSDLATVLWELSCATTETPTISIYENEDQMHVTPLSHYSRSSMHLSSATTLKNRNCANKKLEFESPLKTFIESPLLKHQVIIKENKKQIKKLRESLHFEENKVIELEEQYKDALCKIQHKDEVIKELKEKVKYLEEFEILAEEQCNLKTECEEKISFLEKKYDQCQKCECLEDLKKENVELQETCARLEKMSRNMQIKIESTQKENLEKDKHINALVALSGEDNEKIVELNKKVKLLTECIEDYRSKCLEKCVQVNDSYLEPIQTPQRVENETLRGVIDRKNQELEEELRVKNYQIEALIEIFGHIQNWSIAEVDKIKRNVSCWLKEKLVENFGTEFGMEKSIEITTLKDTQTINSSIIDDIQLKILDKNTQIEKPQNEHVQSEKYFWTELNELKNFFEKQIIGKVSEINFANETIKNYKQKINELEQHILLIQKNYEFIKEERENDIIKLKKLETKKTKEKIDLQEEICEYKLHIEDLNDKIEVVKKDCEHIQQEKYDVMSKISKLEINTQKLVEERHFLDQSYQNIMLEYDQLKEQVNESLQWKDKTIELQNIKISELEESTINLKNDYEHVKSKNESSIRKLIELECSNMQLSLELETSRKNIENELCSEVNTITDDYSEVLARLTNEKNELVDELKALRNEKTFFTETFVQLENDKKTLTSELETLKAKYEIQRIESDLSEALNLEKQNKTITQEEKLKKIIKDERNETDNSKLTKLENTIQKQIKNQMVLQENVDIFTKLEKPDKNEVMNLKSQLSNAHNGLQKSESHAVCEKQAFINCHNGIEHATCINKIESKQELKNQFEVEVKESENSNFNVELLLKEKANILKELEELRESSKNEFIKKDENIRILKEKCDSYKKMVKESMNEIKELREKIKGFVKSQEIKETEIVTFIAKYKKTKENLKRLSAENEDLKKKSKSMTCEMETLVELNQKLKNELCLSRKCVSPVKRQIEVFENLHEVQKNENKKLYSELQVAQNEISELKATASRVHDFQRCLSASDLHDLKDSPLLSQGYLNQTSVPFKSKLLKIPSINKTSGNDTPKREGNRNLPVVELKKKLLDGANSENDKNTDSPKTPSVQQRFYELQRRNTLYPAHLKSCYPIEMQVTSPSQVSYESLKDSKTLNTVSPMRELLSPASIKPKKSSNSLFKSALHRSSISPFFEKQNEESTNMKKLYHQMRKMNLTPSK